MKKNGYTLVELILTIGLLATASTIVIVNMVGLKGNQDQDRLKRFEDSIASAACAYIDTIENTDRRAYIKSNCINNNGINNNNCYVKLEELVDNSVALVDLELKDPLTNKKVENLVQKQKYNPSTNRYEYVGTACIRVYVHFVERNDIAQVDGVKIKEKQCEFKRLAGEGCQ